jgi:hypothetical protein
MDFLKASILISTGCSVALTGIAAYSAKKQAELNQIIAQGTQQMAKDSAEMKSFIYSAQK